MEFITSGGIIHGMTSSLVVWSTGLSNQKTYPKTHFPDLCTKKNVRVIFFGVNSPITLEGGEMGFWGHLSPSFQAARGRCIDLELAAKLASPTSTIAELSHSQRLAERGANI